MNMKVAGLLSFFLIFITSATVGAESAPKRTTTWNGLYVGLSAGIERGKADPDARVKEQGYFVNQDPGQLNPLASMTIKGHDLSGGLLWGYAFQKGNWVLGLEADVSAADFNESYSSGNRNYITQPAHTFSITTRVESNWSARLRLRLGYAWEDSLFFAAAGPVWTRLDYTFSFSDTFAPESAYVDDDEVKTGWTAGLGYEKKLGTAWSLRAEWLYTYFHNIIDTDSTLTLNPPDGFTHEVDYETHSLRLCIIRSF
ncbi:MAG: outer membrane beta-barrel protein [Desulfobacterales bacterium]|nr:outer membrane beta-barrel protein [Desulfobacterales bacterium]